MPKVADAVPRMLAPYLWHGLDLTWADGGKDAKGDCPFCGREGKFGVTMDSGLWRCVACNHGPDKGNVNAGGNAVEFLRCLWEAGDKQTSDYEWLSQHRGLLFPETCIHWGCCRSPVTNEWLVPGHGVGGKLDNLYKFHQVTRGGDYRLSVTSAVPHALFGMLQWDAKKSEVWVCEGPWDAMAMWEIVQQLPELAKRVNVVAAPSCNVWGEWWWQLLAGKRVVLFYDGDHPKENRGIVHPGAGWEGMRRVCQQLVRSKEQPEELLCVRWGPEGFNPNLPSGFDVRDHLRRGGDELAGRVAQLEELQALVHPIPKEWISGIPRRAKRGERLELEELECRSWAKLVEALGRCCKVTDGIKRGLAVCLASIASTKSVGDQLWCRIMSPPSTFKSRIALALCSNRKYVKEVPHFTGMYSGYKSDKDGEEDNSLVAMLYDKTMVIKDADTLLQAPNKEQLLSQLRDLYDRSSATHYKNGINRCYQGVNLTVILFGTGGLRQLDTSELGERTIDVVMMEGIDAELEGEIARVKMLQAFQAVGVESNGDPHHQNMPEMTEFMRLTAGYITWLRENAQEGLKAFGRPNPPEAGEVCMDLASLVAHLRSRPSPKQVETVERELTARLVSIICRLAACLAFVMNKTALDAEVMAWVRQCALDTCRGRTMRIVRALRSASRDGLYLATVAQRTNDTDDKARTLLYFLRDIGVVELHHKKSGIGAASSRPSWRLTENFNDLWNRIGA